MRRHATLVAVRLELINVDETITVKISGIADLIPRDEAAAVSIEGPEPALDLVQVLLGHFLLPRVNPTLFHDDGLKSFDFLSELGTRGNLNFCGCATKWDMGTDRCAGGRTALDIRAKCEAKRMVGIDLRERVRSCW